MAPNTDDESNIQALARVTALSELNSSRADQSSLGITRGDQAIELIAKMQRELDTLREQLAWSNRLSQLGILTAALAHETNNLLTPIGSYAQLALANPGNRELTHKALKAAAAGCEKGSKLVQRVMDVASPNTETKSDPALPTSCHVDAVVQDAISFMMPLATEMGVSITSRAVPGIAAIDALSLEQVLINLISNACRAMRQMPGKRRILIETSESNGRLMLRVSDTGPGIPKAILGKLFDPFATNPCYTTGATNATENHKDGNGLGLSICRQLIEAAGGAISLADSSEHGVTFLIDLELVKQG